MKENKSNLDRYIDFLNAHILPFIDYSELERSYHTPEKAYAKGVLNLLHTAMAEQYGSTQLSCGYGNGQEDYAVLPGVIRGKKTGDLAVALLGIDLQSSGEHCETEALCRYGVVTQGDSRLSKQVADEFSAKFIPYDYGYTADVPGDIHVSKNELPDEIKEILDTFQNYTAKLLSTDEAEKEDSELER
ncbi:hypothetical protein [Caproicibacter fermentans]|uniref:Uncharacterized protein n=1 Tax=Caproicibacter fermentans TaxID=2576756 RepID=A0A7G8TF14_9FIRM|nr:hypothetical protein [Caproicibacter fermentans]QNK42205.1 hypothetical protein HCR03_08345 [Caproicibacter fermentans]